MDNNFELNEKLNTSFLGTVEIPPDLAREFNKCVETYDGAVPYSPKKTTYVLDYSNTDNVISDEQLSSKEKEIFGETNEILKLMGGRPKNVESIKILRTSNTLDIYSLADPFGIIDYENKTIYIFQDHLASFASYAGALLHECTTAKLHAISPETIKTDILYSKILGNMAINALDLYNKSRVRHNLEKQVKTEEDSKEEKPSGVKEHDSTKFIPGISDLEFLDSPDEDSEFYNDNKLTDHGILYGRDTGTSIYIKNGRVYIKVKIVLSGGRSGTATIKTSGSTITRISVFKGEGYGYLCIRIKHDKEWLSKLEMIGEYDPATFERDYKIYFNMTPTEWKDFCGLAATLSQDLNIKLEYDDYDL